MCQRYISLILIQSEVYRLALLWRETGDSREKHAGQNQTLTVGLINVQELSVVLFNRSSCSGYAWQTSCLPLYQHHTNVRHDTTQTGDMELLK